MATGYPSRFPVLLLQKRQENIGRRVTDAGTTAKYSPIYAKIRAVSMVQIGESQAEPYGVTLLRNWESGEIELTTIHRAVC